MAERKTKSRRTTVTKSKLKTLSVKKGPADRVKGGMVPGPEDLK